jgi:hypothetical protein
MKREPRDFFNDHQGDYLENPEYDFGCEWVIRNLPRVRALLASNGKVGEDGIVDYGNDSRYLLDALRQIGVRQDAPYGFGSREPRGPVLGIIDVAIVERSVGEAEYSSLVWWLSSDQFRQKIQY